MRKNDDKNFPIIMAICGPSGVGKTSIRDCFNGLEFYENRPHTKGINCLNKELTINNKTFFLKILDCSGNERAMVNKIFFSKANCIILVYDPFDRLSFTKLAQYNLVIEELHKDSSSDLCNIWLIIFLVKVVVANKKDLFLQRKPEVSAEEGKAYANKINARFIETSAKFKEGINELFYMCIFYYFKEKDYYRIVLNKAKYKKTINQNQKCI